MSTQPTACTLKTVALLEGIRKEILSLVEGLTEEEALRVPEGQRNCIHWHLGHMLHVQLAHWFVRRGEPLPVDLGFKKYFRDGMSPADYDAGIPTFARMLEVYREYSFGLAGKFGGILEARLAQPFDYMHSRFETVADDLYLLVFHEGEHHPMVRRVLKGLGKCPG